MASRDSYTVGWICALPLEVAAAQATLDRILSDLPGDATVNDTNNYIFGSLNGHNVVIAYPTSGVYGTTSVKGVAEQLHASFKSIRFSLMVGIGGGVPDLKKDIRLGDVIVSKPTAGRPHLLQFDCTLDWAEYQSIGGRPSDAPSILLLTAAGKTETAAVFDESHITHYVADIVRKDPSLFANPGPEQDVLFDSYYDHTAVEQAEDGCNHCDPDKISPRRPREIDRPVVHYGPIASGNRLMSNGATREKFANEHEILCFETEAAGLVETTHCLLIRGVCDYADSHGSELWHAYAAAVAAAYAKELLSFIPTAPGANTVLANARAGAAPLLDALLLTRPEVDRASLIALKGRRVDGTCEWIIQHPSYQEWLFDTDLPLLWISGGPGKGKTMLAIYLTERLQPVVNSGADVLLYYFCSNRDRNRNTAVTVMRGIIHQWLTNHPHLAPYIKSSFEGTETTKYTLINFVSLWRVFLTLLQRSECRQVLCVLDGLDECEEKSLKQLLDALGTYLTNAKERSRPQLKLILLSRPHPRVLESKLGRCHRIKLDDSDTDISNDVETYIFAKVADLAAEQKLSGDMIVQVQQALLAGAEGTFLWVSFVANELRGRSWPEINDILHGVPKGLGGIYRRLLEQVEDKDNLVDILRWIVLAARPLTIDELTAAAGIKASNTALPTEVTKARLESCGLLVKIEGNVVNLVHESAKEFFQSDQINDEGIRMFRMDRTTHQILMRICLALVERTCRSPRSIEEASLHVPLSAYASLHWPDHFRQAINVMDLRSELSRPIFEEKSAIRHEWWKFYWEQEKNGGTPPSFTLLHLATYFGYVPWARTLLDNQPRLISRKDDYGRMPLFWAVSRGQRDMVELLLDRGARVNAKDRGRLTALHIAVTGEHKEIVALLVTRSADLEVKADAGDTPLIRAIQTSSTEIIELLLGYGARVDGLPTPQGAASYKGATKTLEERAQELLGLQEQLFAARFEQASRRVDMVMKAASFSFRFPIVLQLVTMYLKFMSIRRWESFSVLQELVRENRTDELRKWAEAYRNFFVQLIAARNPKRLAAMTDLPTQVLQAIAPGDLKALLVIAVLVGSETKLETIRQEWREGDTITGRAFSHWASIACRRDAEEFLHYGVREFLADFDRCIQSGNREDNVARTSVLLTSHFAMLENKDTRPIEYFSTVIAEFYEGHISGRHEGELFRDANQACANELAAISQNHDTSRLRLFLTSILQFAHSSRSNGADRFLNMLSASCLLLCQDNANAHRWLISEAIPETMSALIPQQPHASLQKRAYKALVECLIVGRQYGLALPLKLGSSVDEHLHSFLGVEVTLNQIVGS